MVVEINPQVLQFLKFWSWGGGGGGEGGTTLDSSFCFDKNSEKIREVLKGMGLRKKS